MLYAYVETGEVGELRDINLADVPAHKRDHWRLVEGDQPTYDPRTHTISGPTYTIGPTRVLREWTVTKRSDAELIVEIKAEAQRRIIALTGASDVMGCLVKQHNASMRAIEINDRRVSGVVLTPEEEAAEEAEATALRNLATAIKAIRAASNTIEAMTPIPTDFATNETYWT